MRGLCVSIDLPGHLDWGGYLGTAATLARRGHEMVWASGEGVRAAVEAQGLRFAGLTTSGWQHDLPPLPAHLSPQQRQKQRRARALAVWLSPEAVTAALADLLEVAATLRPQVILCEPYAAAGVLLAEKLRLPLAIVGRPALPPTTTPHPAAPLIQELCARAQVAAAYWHLGLGMPQSPHLHLDFFCRSWYTDLPQIAPHTLFCGGAATSGPAPAPDPAARPRVLVTLGSTFSDDETFFRLAAESAVMAGAESLLAVGRRTPRLLASLQEASPPHCQVETWVDFACVFPQLAAVVHHGGVGATHAALIHSLPQIAVPHAGDQWAQAARVTQAGVGYGIRPRDFNLANAPLTLAQLLYNPLFKANAAALAQEMQALGGVEAAATAVERLAG